MRLFYLSRELKAADLGENSTSPASVGVLLAQGLHPQKIHFATGYELGYILQSLTQAGKTKELNVITFKSQHALIERHRGLRQIGSSDAAGSNVSFAEFLTSISPGTTKDIAIISPFGMALGDALMFCTIMREYARESQLRSCSVRLHLFQAPYNENVRVLCERSGLFTSIRGLPAPVDDLARLDAFVDFSQPLEISQAPWIDLVFELGGIPPHEIPPKFKRNKLALPPAVELEMEPLLRHLLGERQPIIIFHQLAGTPIRNMPPKVAQELLSFLLENTDYYFISLTPFDFEHPRFKDVSRLSTSTDRYMYLISAADSFLTVDTSLYHIADAFDVPGVVIFSTNLIERFGTYYPYIKGVQLPGIDQLGGKHWSEDENDIAHVEELWKTIDPAYVAELLTQSVALAGSRQQCSRV
jgi:glycosyl transferase family 9 (putative heptosyltransferase)